MRSPRLRACVGVRSWSTITRSTSLWKARMTRSSSLPEPTTVLGSTRRRFCVTTSTMATPAERASSRSSAICTSRSCALRPAVTETRIACSRSPMRRVAVRRASAVSRSRIQSWKSKAMRAGGCGSRHSMPASRSPGERSPAGVRAAVWASAGRPSSSMPTVTMASRRSSSRSVRSSRVSPSVPRWVWRQRSAAQTPAPRPAGGPSRGRANRVRVAHHHVLDQPAAVEQHADLAPNLVADFGQVTGELVGDQPLGRHPPPEEALELTSLTGLEAVRITEDLDRRCLSGAGWPAVRQRRGRRRFYVALATGGSEAGWPAPAKSRSSCSARNRDARCRTAPSVRPSRSARASSRRPPCSSRARRPA